MKLVRDKWTTEEREAFNLKRKQTRKPQGKHRKRTRCILVKRLSRQTFLLQLAA
jgi:hypothetical protein